MKFITAAFSALLAAEAVFASPVTLVPRTPRVSRRARGGGSRTTRPMSGTSGKTESGDFGISSTGPSGKNVSNTAYSSNWSGAVLVGTGYTEVTGTFTVPTPAIPAGGSSTTEYAASAWVGLDGDTCSTAILQTGIDLNIEGSTISFDAWYEWYPDYAYTFSGFGINAGDVIRLTATATSTTSGSVEIDNLTTGQAVVHAFSAESASAALCETNAEWIVEDFEENGELVPFANFGSITFTDASVVQSGVQTGISNPTIIDLRQSGSVLTSCLSTTNSVTCTYI